MIAAPAGAERGPGLSGSWGLSGTRWLSGTRGGSAAGGSSVRGTEERPEAVVPGPRAHRPSLTAGGTQPPPPTPPPPPLRAHSGPAPASRGRCCPRAGPRAPRPISDRPNGHASHHGQSTTAPTATPRGTGSRTAAPHHVIEAGQSPPAAPPRPGAPRAAAGRGAKMAAGFEGAVGVWQGALGEAVRILFTHRAAFGGAS